MFTIEVKDKARSRVLQLLINAGMHNQELKELVQENYPDMEQDFAELAREVYEKIHEEDGWCIDDNCED